MEDMEVYEGKRLAQVAFSFAQARKKGLLEMTIKPAIGSIAAAA